MKSPPAAAGPSARPSTRNGEVTTIVRTSRRIIIGALLAPYTDVFEEFARSHKKRQQQLCDVMITKQQFFDLMRRGICPAALTNAGDSVISDTAQSLLGNYSATSQKNNAAPSAQKLGSIELKEYSDSTILDDLEFVWSEITILLADVNDDDAGRMRRLMSKKFQSFKAANSSTNGRQSQNTMIPSLDLESVQQSGEQQNDNTGKHPQVDLNVSAQVVESEDDESDLVAMATVDHEASKTMNMGSFVKRRLMDEGVEPRDEVPVNDLILRLSVASSPSPTITENESAHIIAILDECYKRPNDEITRNAFMLLLKKHANEPELKGVEIEELVLYLFPDDVNEVGCLRELIHRCQTPSNHHGFAVRYAEQRLHDWGDAKELFFYVPFLVLYLCLVVSGKFITPRSYYGYGASDAITDALFTSSFTSCSYDAENLAQCNDTKTVTATTLSGRIDWFYYMKNIFVPTVWSSTTGGTAAETIIGNDLRLVGAIKIRNMRVYGVEDHDAAQKYFGLSTSTFGTRFPKYSSSVTDTSAMLGINASLFPANSVLSGFDGRTHYSCDELNATGSILGNIDTFSCDGHAVIIPLNTTRDTALEVLDVLAESAWVDRQTRAMVVEFIVFHPVSTMFIRTQMLVEFQAGGGLYTTTTIHPFTFYNFSSVDSTFSGLYMLFFVLLFFNIARYILWNLVRPLVMKGSARDFMRFRPHMILDFCNYAMFLASAISRLLWMSIGSPEDPVWLVTYYPDGYEDAELYFNAFVIIDSFNVLLSVIGLARFGKFIPSMGIVVTALSNAAKDAVALLFVIVGTFMSLVVCAAGVFGDAVLGYHTVLWAAETLGQVLIGNYSYTDLHKAHPTFAYVFFFVFQLSITVILLNMFIAVFTDAFTTAMDDSFDRVTSTHILDNTAQHPFVRSSLWSHTLGSMPVQTVRALFRRAQLLWSQHNNPSAPQVVDFLSYDKRMARSFRLLFSTANIGLIASKRGKLQTPRGGHYDSNIQLSATINSINTTAPESTMNLAELLQSNIDKETLRIERVHASRMLLQLLDKIALPRVQAATVSSAAALRAGVSSKSKHGATNIYDYIHDQVGHDYALIMTFFVILPQTLFSQPGEYLLNRTMGAFVQWRKRVMQLSLRADEDVLLEMRLRSVVQERQGHAAAHGVGKSFDGTAPRGIFTTQQVKRDPAALFLDRLDTFHRRLFLAIIACSPVMEGAVAKERIRVQNGAPPQVESPSARAAPQAVPPVAGTADAHENDELRPPSASHQTNPSVRRVDFVRPSSASPAVTPFRANKDLFLTLESFTKICHHNEVLQQYLQQAHQDYEAYMAYKFPSGGEQAKDSNGNVPSRRRSVAWENDGNSTRKFNPLLTVEKLVGKFTVPETSTIRLEDFRFHVYEEFGEQALSFGFTIGETQRIEQYLEVRARRQQRRRDKTGEGADLRLPAGDAALAAQATIASVKDDEDNDDLFVTLRGDEHLEDVATSDPASFYILEEREFETAWKVAKRTSPPDEVKERVFSLFPTTANGKRLVDMRMFLKFCRESVHAHKNVSFSRHYCEAEQQRLFSVMWILFYIPLFVVTLFFLFYESPLGETIWLSEGLTNTFAAPSATSKADVVTWMSSCVKSVFPLPSSSAAIHNNANFYVGTMRFRQQRVEPSDCSQQYIDYFGASPGSRELRFPSSIPASQQPYYAKRVARDYADLFEDQRCFGAYDFGSSQSDESFLKAPSPYPEVNAAFSYQGSSVSNEIDAFNSKYPAGGFVFDLNYTILGSYAYAAISDLVTNDWVDNATRVVALEIVVLNLNVDVVARGRFGVELTSGGAFETFRSVYVTRVEYPSDGLFRFFQVVFWCLLAIYVTAVTHTYVLAVQMRVSVYGENIFLACAFGFVDDFGVPWDLAIIGLMISAFALRFHAAAGDSFSTVYNNGAWPFEVENALDWAKSLKQVEGVSSFMVFIRFLYFIGLNTRRFALVINTLRESTVELLSIIVLWLLALAACTLSAVICFGYGTLEAYSFQSAFFDLFNTASGGNPNYYSYTSSRREAAPVFWVLYFVVTFFVLYNMVVAVLTGKFADVKAQNFLFDTVNRVMLQEVASEWYRRFADWKFKLWSGFLFQEVRQVYLKIRYGWGLWGTPLRLSCQNPRSCWTFMVETWRTQDMGIPADVLRSAVTLISLEMTVAEESGRWEHVRTSLDKQRVIAALNNNIAGGNVKLGESAAPGAKSPSPHQEPEAGTEQPPPQSPTVPALLGAGGIETPTTKSTTAGVKELITYADRRLPLWNEYIYYIFQGERDLVQRYLVGLPSTLLSWRLTKLWLHAVESAHYFNLLRSSYTVDLSESRVAQLIKVLPNVEDIDAEMLQHADGFTQQRNNA